MKRFLWVGAWTFVLSVVFSLGSKALLTLLGFASSFLLLLFIVLVGIVFDIIGVAATAARETPFHAMAADKVRGSVQAIWLVRNADKVATFSNDMVGDVAGTLSGAVAVGLVFQLVRLRPALSEALLTTLMVALVAAVAVGGKASGKGFALKNASRIVFLVARIICALESFLGFSLTSNSKQSRRRKSSGSRR